jgi:hypothetical protein
MIIERELTTDVCRPFQGIGCGVCELMLQGSETNPVTVVVVDAGGTIYDIAPREIVEFSADPATLVVIVRDGEGCVLRLAIEDAAVETVAPRQTQASASGKSRRFIRSEMHGVADDDRNTIFIDSSEPPRFS